MCYSYRARVNKGLWFFRYKKDLNSALDREASAERHSAQLDLDWQRRFDNVERNHYEKSEQYIERLTEARDQVNYNKIIEKW